MKDIHYEEFLKCAADFTASVDAAARQDIKLSEDALSYGDADTSDYYATRAIAKNEVLKKFMIIFNDLIVGEEER